MEIYVQHAGAAYLEHHNLMYHVYLVPRSLRLKDSSLLLSNGELNLRHIVEEIRETNPIL